MLSFEKKTDGIVCGIDEAGRAPLAGPVTAACVYIPAEFYRNKFWQQVTDSKKLSPERRAALRPQIQEHSYYGIAHASVGEIDAMNIHHATLLAMRRAYEAMCKNFTVLPDMALIDGKFCPPDMSCKAEAVIGGDSRSLSIASASILAKVERDTLMQDLHVKYPHFGWLSNAGYPTPQHKAAITEHGITPHHRRSFQPVRAYLEEVSAK